jgi:hypothetical protein
MERFDDACPIRLGDPWEHIRVLLGISEESTPYTVDGRPQGSHIRLEEQGIWIFLDDANRVRSIRFDRPFRGRIDGVAVSDRATEVLRIKGRPDRKWPVSDGIRRWLYDEHGFMRIDFDADDAVETIFV